MQIILSAVISECKVQPIWLKWRIQHNTLPMFRHALGPAPVSLPVIQLDWYNQILRNAYQQNHQYNGFGIF